MALYNSTEEVDIATQSNYIEKGSEIIYLGNNGSYSFNLPPESIQQYEVYYIFNKTDMNAKFDSIYLTYYTSKNKKVESKIFEIQDGWDSKELNMDRDWIKS
ncbi:hypothetical protein LNK15_08350 [Jeotgalicoccus huakuii]|nr:hypothetical protein [Jeotgalicoccus huakuii]